MSCVDLLDPEDVAKAASLRYVSDTAAGITRTNSGKGFTYRDPAGKVITDAAVRARIEAIGIPPAWTHVWIAPQANGHIQATGRDARGRKQYRYHAKWQALRGEHKFGRMLAFGTSLPTIRQRVNADMALAGHSREKVLAIVVRLLETTYIRIGNEEYARDNGSFGLTTLRNKHVQFTGSTLRFDFVGKMGKPHSIRVTDRRLARLVRRCRELPGQALFQYRDDAGATRAVGSTEVNDYIREIAGDAFTAKDFRTWAGSLLAISCLTLSGETDAVPTLKSALKEKSTQLGNTPAVCRSGYIHPLILAAYTDDALRQEWRKIQMRSRARVGLTRVESALLAFLAKARCRVSGTSR